MVPAMITVMHRPQVSRHCFQSVQGNPKLARREIYFLNTTPYIQFNWLHVGSFRHFAGRWLKIFFFSGRRYKSPRRATLFSQYRGMLVVTKGPAPLLHHCVHLRAVSQHFSVLWRRHLGIWGLGNNQGRDYRE